MLESCAECGFVYDLEQAGQSGAVIAGLVPEYAALLTGDDAALRRRPRPETWSALEYACHVRDVLLTQRERVLQARRESLPALTPMGRDERVEHEGYNEQDPRAVTRQLSDAALLFGNVLDRLSAEDWERGLIYPYPDPNQRSLRWLAVHTVHEVRHHLLDIRRQLAR